MSLVSIYGYAWDHARQPIPAELQPRLWAIPRRATITRSLNVATEILCDLNAATGQFSFEVESDPEIEITFRMDWLQPGQEQEPPEKRVRGFEEWPIVIHPGNGGLIGDLNDNTIAGVIYAGNGKPSGYASAWFDLTDETEDGVMLYATEGTV